MNSELYAFQSQNDFRPGNAADESTQAAEKMLMDSAPRGKEQLTDKKELGTSDQSQEKKCPPGEKCYGGEPGYDKLDRFLLPSEMNIPWSDPTSRTLLSGDVISQKGTTQRLSLRDGSSIEVNGDGTYAVRDAQGNRLRGEELLIKPTPGNEPRGLTLAFGDDMTANIVDGTINFRTSGGASIDVDNRGFASISRPESLRLEPSRRK